MNINEEKIVGELVAEDYRTAAVFKKHGIDFCCKGNRSINDVCNKNDIDQTVLIKELNQTLTSKENQNTDYQSWPLDLLADYIEKKHHRYVETKITEIKPFLDKLCKVHGGRHPELFEINELFVGSAGELAMHMKKEELVLFPFVRKMVKVQAENGSLDKPHFGTVQNPVQMMMVEHDTEGERFRRIAEITDNYTPPSDACATYKVTFSLLQEFEEDLHLHIHLENNILFPKAIELEKELSSVAIN